MTRGEKYFKEACNKLGLWSRKLQVNTFAHTKTVGDFWVIAGNRHYIFECKDVDLTKNYKSFPFSRLTQEQELEEFDNLNDVNAAYVVLLFWNGTLKKSDVYILSIGTYLSIKKNMLEQNKKSINVDYLRENSHWFGKFNSFIDALSEIIVL